MDKGESGRMSNTGSENIELKNDTEKLSLMSAESSMDEGNAHIIDPGDEDDNIPADDLEQNLEGAEAAEGTSAGQTPSSEPGEGRGDEPPSGNIILTSEDFDAGEGPETKALAGPPHSRKGSVAFEVGDDDDDDDDDDLPRLDLETPERETTGLKEEDEEGDAAASPPDEGEDDIDYEEYLQLLHQLQAEREKACQHSSQLQMKLVDYFRMKTGDDAQLEKDLPVSDQEQRYEKYMNTLADLKQERARRSEMVWQQTEDLRLQSQEKLGQVEDEWRAFVALKRDVAAMALSRRLGKRAARAKVEQLLASEQHRQDELTHLRLLNVKLKIKTRRLEAELRAKEDLADDAHRLDFEQLQAENQEFTEKIEKQSEELFKLRKKITDTVVVLTHVREKLHWSQLESQAKRAQLAEVEAEVAGKRDQLTRIKQARNGLHRGNLKLKQRCGLLGNSLLLRDFEDKVDTSDQLEERLGDLKCQQADIVLKCARWKKKLGTGKGKEEEVN